MDATHHGMTILAVREIETGQIETYECLNYDTARARSGRPRQRSRGLGAGGIR
jgi:hypothetical protein